MRSRRTDWLPATVPGEAGASAQLMVNGFDRVTGVMSISFGVPCAAADHTIQYAELTRANLDTYNWSGQECSIGVAGAYDWQTTNAPEALFFVSIRDSRNVSASMK